jgi:hypothetical protein
LNPTSFFTFALTGFFAFGLTGFLAALRVVRLTDLAMCLSRLDRYNQLINVTDLAT